MRSFNADEKTRELVGAEVTIGGEVLHPARLTPDVRSEQIAIGTESAKLAREANLNSDGELTEAQLDSRQEAIAQIDQGVYRQLSVLLRDQQDEKPSPTFLMEHVDQRVAGELLSWLLQDDLGESPAATTAPATGS